MGRMQMMILAIKFCLCLCKAFLIHNLAGMRIANIFSIRKIQKTLSCEVRNIPNCKALGNELQVKNHSSELLTFQ